MTVEYYEATLAENDLGNVLDADIYFDTFEKTFNYVMFSMIVGAIYPNPATIKFRMLCMFGYVLVMVPVNGIIMYDGYISYKERNVDSIFRHTIVMGPFNTIYLKMLLMLVYRKKAKTLIEEMNDYFAKLNSQPISHKRIAKEWLNKGLLLEKSWSFCVFIGSIAFPVTAIFKNTYSSLFNDEPERYFVHESRSPFGENTESPFYELFFANTCIASCMYYLNFTGYDGYFVQLIFHAVMRLAVCGEALKDVFKIDDKLLRRTEIRKVIQEHISICKFMDDINNIFKEWMSVITFALVIHLCSCVFFLSKRSSLQGAEFAITMGAAFLYIFMMCACGGLIQDHSETLADTFYECGWERVPDTYCRNLLVFMIARAQNSLQVKALNMYPVNLQLFARIIKMAYSMFTFIQQT